MGRKIWDGTKRACRFVERLLIWYMRICLLIWVVALVCIWVGTSYHAGHLAGLNEMKTALDAWGLDALTNDRADSARVGR